MVRSDYQISEKQSLFIRYTTTAYLRPPSYTFTPNNLLSTGQGGFDDRAQAWIVGDTYLFSPTTVNAFRAAWDRVAVGLGDMKVGAADAAMMHLQDHLAGTGHRLLDLLDAQRLARAMKHRRFHRRSALELKIGHSGMINSGRSMGQGVS